MNSAILRGLKEEGHEVSSAVWHHDISYFLPNDQGNYEFEEDGNVVCQIHPFHNIPQKNGPELYDIIKDFNPELVISIGDYTDTDFIFSVKSLMPNQFKWISILTIDTCPINERRKDAFEFIDYAIVTNKMALEEVKKISNVDVAYIPFGKNEKFNRVDDCFSPKDQFRVINCSKNSQASSTAAFIKAVVIANSVHPEIKGYLHTNITDRGDYDIDLLMERYDAHDIVELPEKSVSLNDGIPDDSLNMEYNRSDVVVDASVRSATGLVVLEAMGAGCIPLVTNVGAIGEIGYLLAKDLAEDFDFYIGSNMYIGQFEEYYEVICFKSLTEKIISLYKTKRDNPARFDDYSLKAIAVSGLFSENNFVNEIKDIVKNVGKIDRKIDLEIL